MKITFLSILLLLFLLAGCALEKQVRLPDLVPMQGGQEEPACGAVFPQGKWQFVHAIDFTMKDGAGTPVVGVTTLAENDDIEIALVTVEGLTLFEAVYHGKERFAVLRAVPPFDKAEFAQGLIGDIRAIFQQPTGRERQTGQLPEMRYVCRYKDVDGGVVDVLLGADDCWQIKSYSSDRILNRSIVGRACRKKGSNLIPEYLEMQNYGHTGYTLKMTLIRADNLP